MINIIKPKFDLRDFIGGTLENNIKYILIHDKFLKSSYVSITINIGCFADPIDTGGLAHFLEHMLFMGSHKYPKVNYFFNKLKEKGGYSNAYTDQNNTVYYFNTFNDNLDELFDIFSRFFIDPLFNESTIYKEVNAVNEEHMKNINNDNWKLEYFIYFLMNKNSFLNKFSTGSLETLNKPNIKDLLLDFYNKYYNSDNISICIASSLSINKMYEIINNSFGHIEKKISEKIQINKPFYIENKLNIYHLKSLSNIFKLIFLWEIPNQEKYLYSRDFLILKLILLNNSENSLYFYLTNLGYIINLDISINKEGIFIFEFNLTILGFDNINTIQSILFSYLNYIYTLDIKIYAEYFKKINHINFDNNNKTSIVNLCNLLASEHLIYNTKDVYYNSLNICEIKKSYNELFKKYINETNFIKIIISNYDIDNYKYLELPYYTHTYYTKLNDKNKIIKYDNKIKIFNLNNNYIDLKIDIINDLDKFNIPILINNSLNEWYGSCSKYNEPIVNICLQLNNINYFNSPLNYLLTLLSCEIINFLLSIEFYDAFNLYYNIIFIPSTNLSSILI